MKKDGLVVEYERDGLMRRRFSWRINGKLIYALSMFAFGTLFAFDQIHTCRGCSGDGSVELCDVVASG